MRIKKYAAAFLAATTVLGSLAACGGDKAKETAKDTTPTTEQGKDGTTPDPVDPGKVDDPVDDTPKATPIPDRDLQGQAFIIGDHWSPETPAEPLF